MFGDHQTDRRHWLPYPLLIQNVWPCGDPSPAWEAGANPSGANQFRELAEQKMFQQHLHFDLSWHLSFCKVHPIRFTQKTPPLVASGSTHASNQKRMAVSSNNHWGAYTLVDQPGIENCGSSISESPSET